MYKRQFRWRLVPERRDSCELEPGMVTSDEPGIYIEGSHGIRTENELLCCAGAENEYGQFLHFETLTLAPIDLAPVRPEEMTAAERAWLNAYHARVYAELAPRLSEEERVPCGMHAGAVGRNTWELPTRKGQRRA